MFDMQNYAILWKWSHKPQKFKPCKNCALGKAKKTGVHKKAVACSKEMGERLFFDISSLSTPIVDGEKIGF